MNRAQTELNSYTRDLQNNSCVTQSAAVVITRPPEIIACLKQPVEHGNVFIVFDSHPRPKHPDGVGIIITTSLEEAASHINDILAVDKRLLSDSSLQWQAQLLAHFSGHFYAPKDIPASPADIDRGIMESSIAVLALRAQVAELKSRNALLESSRDFLENQVQDMEDRLHQQAQIHSQPPPCNCAQHVDESSPDTQPGHSNAQAGPSNLPAPSDTQRSYQTNNIDQFGFEAAQLLQLEFDRENESLLHQREDLAGLEQMFFDCGICLEQHPVDDIARVDSCAHSFCRSCIRQYVQAELKEHHYPIFCPTCKCLTRQSEPCGECLLHSACIV